MRRLVLLLFVIVGCTASGDSASTPAPREDTGSTTTCGGFAQGASCTKPGTELGTCPCADGNRVVCCDETGTAQVSVCTQMPIRCSIPDSGDEDGESDATESDTADDGG